VPKGSLRNPPSSILKYWTRVKWERDRLNIVLSQSRENRRIRVDRTVIDEQKRWFSSEFINCPEPVHERDQKVVVHC
jgi:hypothetical protein